MCSFIFHVLPDSFGSMKLGLCFVLVLVAPRHTAGQEDNLLVRTLDALTRSLNYMLEHVAEINLDAVFCARRVQEQLHSFLVFQPAVFRRVRRWVEVLRDRAARVADEGTRYVYVHAPAYAHKVGLMTNLSSKIAWYASENTSVEYVVPAVECSNFTYNYHKENSCYHQLSGGEGTVCGVHPSCSIFNSQLSQRDYGITHQVLYWQAMEGHECVGRFSRASRRRFCSNVMRDANKISEDGVPNSHADLFMEQVGLCGMWGFRDFNRKDWLEAILEWQSPSGCYSEYGEYFCFDEWPKDTLKRVKRREHRHNDGCLSHKTAVAMLALVVNVRFEAEKNYLRMIESDNSLNALLDGLVEK